MSIGRRGYGPVLAGAHPHVGHSLGLCGADVALGVVTNRHCSHAAPTGQLQTVVGIRNRISRSTDVSAL